MDDTNKVVVQLVGDIGEFKTTLQAGVAALVESGKQMVASMRPISDQLVAVAQSNARIYATLNNAMQQSAAQSQQSSSAITSSIQAMASSVTTSVGQVNASFAALLRSNQQMMTSLNLNIQRTREELSASISGLGGSASAHRAHATAVGVNSTAIREFLVIMREAASGNTNRLAGSLSILGGQFKATRAAIEAVFSPLGALIATFGGFIYFQNEAEKAQIAVRNALQLSGNMAGLTDKSFVDLTQKVAEFSRVSNSQARTSLLELTKAGFLTKAGMENLSEAAVMLGRKTGDGTDEALKYLMKMRDGATRAARDMIKDGYDLLTAAQIREISYLDQVGEHQKAQELLASDVKKSLKEMADNTSELSKMFQTLSLKISNATGEMVRFVTNTSNAEERIKRVGSAIEHINTMKSMHLGFLVPTGQLEALEKQLAESTNAEKKHAEDSKNVARNIEAVQADIYHESLRKNSETLDIKLKEQKHYQEVSTADALNAATKAGATEQQKQAIITSWAKRGEEERAQLIKRYSPVQPKKEKGASTGYERFNEELEATKTGHEKILAEEHRFYSEEQKIQDELIFLRSNKNSFKDLTDSNRVEIQKKIDVDIGKLTQDRLKAEKAAYKEDNDQERTSIEQKIANANKMADMAFNPKGGANQSKEYIEALAYIDKLEKQQSSERIKEQQDVYKGFATTELEKVDDVRAALKIQLDEHKISSAQYLEVMRIEAARELEIKKKLLNDELALEVGKGGGADIAKIESLNNQKLAMERDYAKQLAKINHDAAKAAQKPWDDFTTMFGKAISSRLDSALKKQITYGQAVRYSVGDLVSYELKEGEKWVAAKALMYLKDTLFHTGAETEKTLATTVGETTRLSVTAAASAEGLALKAEHAVAQIAMDAWTAMAGAYAAIAAIPYVGPVLAPVAAAAAFAGVIAISHNIASAEGGYDVPRGVNPIVQVHEEEKILPKGPSRTLDTLQSMLSSGAAMGGKGGDTHHHWNVAPNQDFFGKSPMQVQRATAQAMKRVR